VDRERGQGGVVWVGKRGWERVGRVREGRRGQERAVDKREHCSGCISNCCLVAYAAWRAFKSPPSTQALTTFPRSAQSHIQRIYSFLMKKSHCKAEKT
jgi:hypothetical protein